MNKKILLFLLLFSVLLVGCTKTISKVTDGEKFKQEYENLNGKQYDNVKIRSVNISKDNPFIYKNAEDIIEMINQKKSFVVYFGYAKCPWCRSMIEELIDVAKENKINEIYYVDILNIRDIKEVDENGNITTTKEGTKGYNQLLEKLDSLLQEYTIKDQEENEVPTNEKRIYAPNVVVIINGRPNKLETGNSPLQKDPYQELTKEIKEDMHQRLDCILKCLNEAKTTCDKQC